MEKLIYGVGIYAKGEYQATTKGKINKEYDTWHSMMRRCYCPKLHDYKPSYRDCKVEESWHYFQTFAKWCSEQVGFNNKGWALDKDILLKGNKLYSETTCCFVPPEINASLILRQRGRGSLPLGVTKYNSKYCAKISEGGKSVVIFSSDDPLECFEKYKIAKEYQFKCMAEKYKNVIDDRVYQALMRLEVDIED